MKPDITTGSVLALIRVSMTAKRNSFQARIAERMAVATSAGAERGSTIFQNRCQAPQPSIIAARSSSAGSSS
jgi:hypothetical protein